MEGENGNATKIPDCLNQPRNDDLIDLLNEAKSTILELRTEIESLKSEIDRLRRQNLDYNIQIESMRNQPQPELQKQQEQEQEQKQQQQQAIQVQNPIPPNPNSPQIQAKSNAPPGGAKENSMPIPLEPIIIVKETHVNKPSKYSPEVKDKCDAHETVPNARGDGNNSGDHSMASDRTSASENTFVV